MFFLFSQLQFLSHVPLGTLVSPTSVNVLLFVGSYSIPKWALKLPLFLKKKGKLQANRHMSFSVLLQLGWDFELWWHFSQCICWLLRSCHWRWRCEIHWSPWRRPHSCTREAQVQLKMLPATYSASTQKPQRDPGVGMVLPAPAKAGWAETHSSPNVYSSS